MSPSGHYQRSPLTEAILDIQVELAGDFVTSELAKCHTGVAKEYPNSQDVTTSEGIFKFGESPESSASTKKIGYRFSSAAGSQLFQARIDGFTFNRLAPYNGWDLFRTEAKRLWLVYKSVAKPLSIKRVAVRYINCFDFPHPYIDLKEYFKTSPEIASDLPQGMAQFFMQVVLPLPDVKSHVIITQTNAVPKIVNTISVHFDLDLCRTEELPQDEDGLWSLLEEYRSKKKMIFEACITDELRKLIR